MSDLERLLELCFVKLRADVENVPAGVKVEVNLTDTERVGGLVVDMFGAHHNATTKPMDEGAENVEKSDMAAGFLLS